MLLAQFGSKPAQGWQPIWFNGTIGQKDETLSASKSAVTDLPWGDYGTDGYGARRAPPATSEVVSSGSVYCNERVTAYEWERMVRSFVGVKDWLIGYRGGGCKCGACGPYVRCCNVCGSEQEVIWLAMKARLREVSVTGTQSTQSMSVPAPIPVQLSYEPYSVWQRMTKTRWVWGRPEALDTVPSDTTLPPDVDEFAWPCEFPPCTLMPPFRFYRRSFTWQQNYCVGNWSAGRWIRSSIDGEAIIQVPGDTFPLSRLAFTNFTELTVTVYTPTGFNYSFTIGDRFDRAKWVGEPQYLLITPTQPPQIRFCPVHDDECLDLVPGVYADIAQNGAPVPVESQTVPVLGHLWPGRNILSFSGFRLPGHPFHYSYDLTPRFL